MSRIWKFWGRKAPRGDIIGNRKWKDKLLVARQGFLFYFDKTDISESNRVSRVIPLDMNCRVDMLDAASADSSIWTSAGPAVRFVVNTAAERDDEGSKWSLTALWRYLEGRGVDVPKLRAQIEDIAVKTLIAGEPNILSKVNQVFVR